MESGATKDDPVVRISLEILKRFLLLHDTPAEELEGLSALQEDIKKRYNGMKKALEEVARQRLV
jgi:hypothetical protein